ncbi:MAG TPA: glycosyltransferase family 2 protein [Pseudobacteroides sp.]|uniref:glycosyltransferase family 2 protein n=1 Tax=Pseudobacteroides sp. TaxID=1968840 RepID=UPI002F9501E0
MNSLGVSVIIPAYNAEKTISKCLLSVVNDDYCQEIIVINDGSTDDTQGIVNKLANEYANIRLINCENGGVSKARNLGLREACAEYVMFLDSDDYISENAASEAVTFMSYNKLDLCCIDIVEDNIVRDKDNRHKRIQNNLIVCDNEVGKYIYSANPRSVWAKVYRRKVIIDNELCFDEKMSYAEDLVFVLQYLAFTTRLGFCAEARYIVQNVNPQSLSKKYQPNIEYVINRRNETLLKLFSLYPDYQKEYFKNTMGLDCYSIIVYSDNLFKMKSPYGFWESCKLIEKRLVELVKTEEYKNPKDFEMPKKRTEKLYYKVIRTKSPFLVGLMFFIKNKIKSGTAK